MTKAIAQTYNIAQQYRALITLGFIGASLIALMAYCVNVYAVVSHTIAIQSLHKQVTALASDVSALDARYLELGSAVTPDAVAAYGLTPASVSAYIPRSAATPSPVNLATRGHEF